MRFSGRETGKDAARLRRPLRGISVLALAASLCVSACDETGSFKLGGTGASGADAARSVERDVEAPEVYQLTETGLWDGRPSLGGVWVAEPRVSDPERVIIRNEANGSFVIGALFRREQNTPGPRVQVSSDAAEALGMLAGQPARLNITALRRQEVAPKPTPGPTAPVAGGEISQESLETTAAEAIAAAEAASAKPQPTPTAAPAPAPASPLSKPFVQIGIFNVEQNARNTATSLRNAGLVPTVRAQTGNGRPFWRVIVGPSRSSADRASVLKTVKGLGFSDAYFVTN